jgi:hypothetical protein
VWRHRSVHKETPVTHMSIGERWRRWLVCEDGLSSPNTWDRANSSPWCRLGWSVHDTGGTSQTVLDFPAAMLPVDVLDRATSGVKDTVSSPENRQRRSSEAA